MEPNVSPDERRGRPGTAGRVASLSSGLDLLAVGFYPPRALTGAERSGWNAACQLARAGHRLRIVTEAFGSGNVPSRPNIESVEVETGGSHLDVHPGDYALAEDASRGADPRRRFVRDSFIAAIEQEVRERCPDAILVNWGAPFTGFALVAARGTGIPVITVVHGSDVHALQRSEFSSVRDTVLESYRRADAVIAVADFLSEMLRGSGVRDVTTIRNAVDPREFRRATAAEAARERKRLGIAERATVFVHVSNLRPVKHPVAIVEAAEIALRRTNDLHILVVGDGPLGPELRRIVGEKGLAHKFTFTGRVPATEVHRCLVAADVHVMSSICEGTPLAILEAQATGRPTIASRVGGIPEIVRHGVDGLLYEPGDVDALASHMIRMVDPGLRRRLWQGAIQSSLLHSVEDLGRAFEDVIRRAISAREELGE